ncbi:radical SAM protein [Abyssisolibacter fermentans]|uniref:radical SAM protein n=1 Tax=Abyssisolibacter fermentans TaxID=1766203 RepID=UPI00082F6859|nr:radical SAM protein [Abyssisolibacter fermentans]
MYPYIQKNTTLHYLDKNAVLYGDVKRYIINNVEVYMSEKIDGMKTKDEIVKEIANDLESDDIDRIRSIFDEFVNSKSLLIKTSETPKSHIIKRTGIKGKKVPLNVILSLTNKCVMSCEHCFKSCSTQGNISISYNKLMNTLKFLSGKTMTVQLTGGEPMAYDRFLDVLDYCSENFETRITTTAVLINKNNIDHFKNVRMIQVSVYSNNPEEHDMFTNLNGSFDKTINGIDTIVQAGIPVCISTIVTKRNKDRIQDMIELALEHGVDKLRFGSLVPMGRCLKLKDQICLSNDEIDEMTGIIDEFSNKYKDKINIGNWESSKNEFEKDRDKDMDCFDCGAGLCQWIINENGNVKPCEFIPDEIFTMGCIEEESVEDILEQYNLNNLARSIKKWEKDLNDINSTVNEICPNIRKYYEEKCV